MGNINNSKEYIKAEAKVISFIKEDFIATSESCVSSGYEQCGDSEMTQGCTYGQYKACYCPS